MITMVNYTVSQKIHPTLSLSVTITCLHQYPKFGK